MIIKSLSEISKNEHPLKKVFRRHRVAQWKVGAAIGVSQAQITKILQGQVKADEDVNAALYHIAAELEAGNAA
jgi:predicted transcriptional regulator